MSLTKHAFDNGVYAALARFGLTKLAAGPGVGAFKRMVRSGGPSVVESAATNPFRPLSKGAVPFVDRSLTATPFNQGLAQARVVPGFGASGAAPVAAGFQQLGGAAAPGVAAAAGAANPLKARLQAAAQKAPAAQGARGAVAAAPGPNPLKARLSAALGR